MPRLLFPLQNQAAGIQKRTGCESIAYGAHKMNPSCFAAGEDKLTLSVCLVMNALTMLVKPFLHNQKIILASKNIFKLIIARIT